MLQRDDVDRERQKPDESVYVPEDFIGHFVTMSVR
jgi:hypothetical protein